VIGESSNPENPESRDGTLKFGFFQFPNKPGNPKTNVEDRRTLLPHGHSEKTDAPLPILKLL
jgi:hypothetical protein